jgi:hypothetical protein
MRSILEKYKTKQTPLDILYKFDEKFNYLMDRYTIKTHDDFIGSIIGDPIILRNISGEIIETWTNYNKKYDLANKLFDILNISSLNRVKIVFIPASNTNIVLNSVFDLFFSPYGNEFTVILQSISEFDYYNKRSVFVSTNNWQKRLYLYTLSSYLQYGDSIINKYCRSLSIFTSKRYVKIALDFRDGIIKRFNYGQFNETTDIFRQQHKQMINVIWKRCTLLFISMKLSNSIRDKCLYYIINTSNHITWQQFENELKNISEDNTLHIDLFFLLLRTNIISYVDTYFRNF